MPLLAIDGPVGAGKSTVARAVAERLGLPILETGAMYRALAWAALRHGDLAPAAEIVALAREIEIELGERVLVGGEDATGQLRNPEVGLAVSVVAAMPEVRAEMVVRQRAWVAARGGGVVEGRDIGTVVFPGADLKIFLTASAQERARRRSLDESPDSLARRDRIDSTRAVAPMAVAPDALVIDTTGLSVDQIVSTIVAALGADR